jgi:predicted MFS family arabinose efflux permease
VLLVTTLAGGGIVTFLPIERPDGLLATVALLVVGLTGAASRWQAGLLADRLGSRLLLPAALAACAVGLGTVAGGLHTSDALVLVGAGVFGIGFGAVQNLTLVLAFSRAGPAAESTASAMWNAAFDAGTGLGALLLGGVSAGIGLPWTYAVVAAVLLLVLPVAGVATRRTARVSPAGGRRSPAASG